MGGTFDKSHAVFLDSRRPIRVQSNVLDARVLEENSRETNWNSRNLKFQRRVIALNVQNLKDLFDETGDGVMIVGLTRALVRFYRICKQNQNSICGRPHRHFLDYGPRSIARNPECRNARVCIINESTIPRLQWLWICLHAACTLNVESRLKATFAMFNKRRLICMMLFF